MRLLYPNSRELSEADLGGVIPPHADGTVRANMVFSLDGATTLHGDSAALSSSADRLIYRHLRRDCDAVIVGNKTGSHSGYQKLSQPLVIVSASGNVQSHAANTIVLTTSQGRSTAEHVHPDVIVCGEQEIDLRQGISALNERGLTRLLCEGGATLLSRFVDEGLIDDLFLTHSPIIVGNDSPRLRLDSPRSFELRHLLEDAGHLFAHYG